MKLAARVASTDSINSPAAISGAMIRYLAASARKTLNDINIYKKTVALKPIKVKIKSIL